MFLSPLLGPIDHINDKFIKIFLENSNSIVLSGTKIHWFLFAKSLVGTRMWLLFTRNH